MATSMNTNNQQEKSSVGLILLIGEIISNEQREDLCLSIQRAFQHIDNEKFQDIIDLFNNLIHENEFQTDSQYRQMASTDHGCLAGFLYLPNFHTVLNVLRDLFNLCQHVSIIFCGQQIVSNGALVLTDSLFTCENLANIFEENPSYIIRDLQIILPMISNQWTRLANNYLRKSIENIQLNDLSNEHVNEEFFGDLFYDRLVEVLYRDSTNFDIHTKLIPRDNSGTIAFDEPNLYILYGQQGEASLFGVRGFVVLVNGGFSRYPSYWNLVRGLQNIDACILTHFDYDVLPGLQTLFHRKTIPSTSDGQLCKPDIGAVFLNHIQRMKVQSMFRTESSTTNNTLLMNLNENIEQFLNDVKQLNIDTFNMVKQTMPINLYRKIAFGSLDLYILHPTSASSDDERMVKNLQKIPIRNEQPSLSVIPLHHWYSSCSLLVWTSTSKTNKDHLVRILYTGACPQTLIFEALNKVQNLDFLHESQPKHTGEMKTSSSLPKSIPVKFPLQKPKVVPTVPSRITASSIEKQLPKAAPKPVIPKAKPSLKPSVKKPEKPRSTPITTTKSEKPKPSPVQKKTLPQAAARPARSMNKETKTSKSQRSVSKTSTKSKETKKPVQKSKTSNVKKPNEKIPNKPKIVPKIATEQVQKLESSIEHQHETIVETEREQKADTPNEHQLNNTFKIGHDQRPETPIEHQLNNTFEIEHAQRSETPIEHQLNNTFEIDHEQRTESPTEYQEEQKTELLIDCQEPLANEIESEDKLENTINDEQTLENHHDINDYPFESETADYEERKVTEFDETLKSEPPSNEIEQDYSFHNDVEEQTQEKSEHDMSADELDEYNETERPASISMNDSHNEHFIESNHSSPMVEINAPSSQHDAMTMGFVEGVSEFDNPFTEKTNELNSHDDNDDDMEIIQHDLSTSEKHSGHSDEEIYPQGLPIEMNNHLEKSNSKSTKTNKSSTLTKSSSQNSTSKSKQTSSSGPIFYVDVAYIPYHGNEHYVDSEFFRRIRARYYILNAVQISRLTLESLIDGRAQWEDKKDIPVTLIPTFDGEQLRQFFVTNKNRLAELNINILPAATRCNVQYDDEGSPAQCIRFNSSFNADE